MNNLSFSRVAMVSNARGLLIASFRFHLAMSILAVQLYTSLLSRDIRDFYPLERPWHASCKKPAALAGFGVIRYLGTFYEDCIACL